MTRRGLDRRASSRALSEIEGYGRVVAARRGLLAGAAAAGASFVFGCRTPRGAGGVEWSALAAAVDGELFLRDERG